MNYNWICQPADYTKSNSLARQLNVSPVTAQILINRGIKDFQAVQAFLKSPLKELHNPFLMKDMEIAVNKIVMLLEEIVSHDKGNEKNLIDQDSLQHQETLDSFITIYGDYDVDGTTGTALLITFFREIGIKVNYYIPERQREGYGLNIDAIRKIAATGTRLIISVDCGISSYDEIAEAKTLNVDIIISDHHETSEKIPPAFAILNPSQHNCPYPYKDLSGVGVAFKLITALRAKLRENPYFKNKLPNLKQYLDLVAIGTIADLAPITGENRIIAYHGLKEITFTQKPGLIALKKVARCNNKDIDASDVGFLLGPRLNAAGRLETAEDAIKLLVSEDIEEATQIAGCLNETNRERQKIQAEIFREAVELVESSSEFKNSYSLVLASENWHQGVIGIVASKLINKYYRPTILIAINGSTGKASGRSIEGFNLFQSVSKCGHLLKKYGGHEMAVGFAIEKKMIDKFKKYFEEESHKNIQDPKIFIPPLKIDAIVPFDEISMDLYKELEMLAPFGFGNPRPILMVNSVTLPVPPAVVGQNGNHLKLRIKGGKSVIEGIGFNMGNLISKFDFETNRFDIAFSISVNRWNNTESIQLKLKDIRLAAK